MIPNFNNDKYYFTYEFEDETSGFDPLGSWQCGAEYYSRTYRCRIPHRIKDNEDLIQDFIDRHTEDKYFWV